MVIEINRHPNRPKVDPREREDWFQRLDEDARDVVRQRWLEDELAWERVGILHRRSWRADLLQGVSVFGGTHAGLLLLLVLFLPGVVTGGVGNFVLHVVAASLVGAAVGAGWRVLEAGQLMCAFSACLLVFLMQLLLGLHLVLAVVGGFFAGRLASYIGLRRTEVGA